MCRRELLTVRSSAESSVSTTLVAHVAFATRHAQVECRSHRPRTLMLEHDMPSVAFPGSVSAAVTFVVELDAASTAVAFAVKLDADLVVLSSVVAVALCSAIHVRSLARHWHADDILHLVSSSARHDIPPTVATRESAAFREDE